MIHLVQPDPGSSVSGGFRFNREMVARLERDGAGRTMSLDALAEADLQPSDAVVLDSLYLSRTPPKLDELRCRVCVLCHFLPSRQPHLDVAARSALARTEREWFRRSDRALVPSFRFETKLRKLAPRAIEVRVVTPGLSHPFRREMTVRREPLDGRPTRLVTVDALTEAKNLSAILDSLRHLDGAQFTWHIAGDLDREPLYRDRFRAELKRSGLAERVTLHGAMPQASVASLLDRADLYVTASREESYGMATAEAVARGLPVVGFDVGCASKWVISGVNGWLIGVRHQGELETVLTRSIRDSALLDSWLRGADDARERIHFPSWKDSYREFRRALGPEAAGRRPARWPADERANAVSRSLP